LTPEAVAAEKERSQSGARRKGLFYRPPSRNGKAIPFTQKMRFLPAFKERGPDGHVRPFFLIGQHWIQKTNDEGEEYGAGITCTDYMQEEQPTAWEVYKKAKVDAVLEDERCIFCEVLDALKEEDDDGEETWNEALPIGQFGSSPAWLRRYAHNFAILLPQEYYTGNDDSDTKVKIYPAPRSVKDGLYTYLDKKQFGSLFEEGKTGWDVDVERFQKGRGPWNYSVTPVEQCPVWYDEWEDELPDLEDVSPNWFSRGEAVEWMQENHPEVISAAGIPTRRKGTSMAAKKGAQKGRGKADSKSAAKSKAKAPAKATKATASKKAKKKTDDDEEDSD
jgi:hypothetical protein